MNVKRKIEMKFKIQNINYVIFRERDIIEKDISKRMILMINYVIKQYFNEICKNYT